MFDTLVDALRNSAKGEQGIVLLKAIDNEQRLSYADLLHDASNYLWALQNQGVQAGDELILQFESHLELMTAYWACLLGGIVPVPLAFADQPDNAQKLLQVWGKLLSPRIASDQSKLPESLLKHAKKMDESAENNAFENLVNDVIAPAIFYPTDILAQHSDTTTEPKLHDVTPDDIAFIQFSSGSTGTPKGVVLTHHNLLTNCLDILETMQCGEDDVFVSWKPLSHDFGMISFHVTPVVGNVLQIRIPTEVYIWSPAIWFHAVDKYRGSILGSPNFGYRHFLKLYKRRKKEGWDWDLSCVKSIINGAEPISAALCDEFLTEMAQYGMNRGAMRPAYGLAEGSLLVTVTPPNGGVKEIAVHRESLSIGSPIQVVASDDPEATVLVDCGEPVPSTEIRIVDANKQVLAENHVGYVEIRGGNVTKGYYHDPEKTAEAINSEGWLNTEDLGFMNNGRVVFASRHKELIILGGVNYFPHDIEKAILAVKGKDKLNHYIACSVPGKDGEQLAIFVYFKKPADKFGDEVASVRDILMNHFGIEADYVIPARSIPKTTSGKVQRFVLRKQLLDGQFNDVLSELSMPTFSVADTDTQAFTQENHEQQTAATPVDKSAHPETNIAEIESIIGQIIANVTSKQASREQSFFELGVPSLRLVSIQDEIEDRFDIVLNPTAVLDRPTIAGLAQLVADQQPSLVEDDSHSTPNADNLASGKDAGNTSNKANITGSATNNGSNGNDQRIAVIGLGCRFPGNSDTPEKYWQLLSQGVDPVGTMSATRWPDCDDSLLTTRQGGFFDQIDLFDPFFFGISPTEAESLDPQQRWLLEVTHEAFEHAGLNVPALNGSNTGVIVGIATSEYPSIGAQLGHTTGAYTYTGSMFNTAVGRLAFTFGLQGPATAVDTACSSSLTAVHFGVSELRARRCDLLVAAAVGLMLTPDGHVCFSHMNALSASGRSRSFDADADGYIRSEGAAAIVLKRLDDAEADGDNILAVIRGTAINHNGHSGGLTVPSGPAQARLIRAALQDANVTADQIDYIEAHGSGTKLGDPQEASALCDIFKDRKDQVLLGAVKSNVGHLEAAAGMAGLHKLVHCLHQGKVSPNLHFKNANPLINWETAPLKIVSELTDLPQREQPNIAGITSLGINGSNAHVIVQAYQSVNNVAQREASAPYLFTLSSKSAASLRHTVQRFADSDLSQFPIQALCQASTEQRSHYPVRFATLVKDHEQLNKKLTRFLDKQAAEQSALAVEAKPIRMAMLFTGQGSHYAGMADELYENFPAYKAAFDQCVTGFEAALGSNINDCLYEGLDEKLSETAIAQACIFSVEYSLAQLWLSMGAQPSVLIGHSIGEYAAACVAGVMSLADAIHMVARRGIVMQNAPAGKMVGLLCDEATVNELIADHPQVSIAAYNAPDNHTIAGEESAVDAVIAAAKKRRVFTERLVMPHPFHTPLMQESSKALAEALKGIEFNAPRLPLYSTTTADWVRSANDMNQTYWQQHLCQPVKFAQALQPFLRFGDSSSTAVDMCIEIGGTATLVGLAAQQPQQQSLCIPSLRQGRPAKTQWLETFAQAYMAGFTPDWHAFYGSRGAVIAELPFTAFNKKPVWFRDLRSAKAATAPTVNSTVPQAVNSATQSTHAALAVPMPPQSTMNQEQIAMTQPTQNSAGASTGVQLEDIKAIVVTMLAEVTGVQEEEFTDNLNLFSVGVDSLMLVQLDKRIVARFDVEISLGDFFTELHTPKKLAEHIFANMSAAIHASFGATHDAPDANGLAQPTAANTSNIAATAPVATAQPLAYAAPQTPLQASQPMQVQTSQPMQAHAPLPAQNHMPAASGDLAIVVQQQLQLMQQQISVLSGQQQSQPVVATAPTYAAATAAPVQTTAISTPAAAQISPTPAASTTPPKQVNNIRDIVLESDELTDVQQAFVHKLTETLIAHTGSSKTYSQQHRAYFADWIATLNFTLSTKEFTFPLVAERSQGSKFWDIDGNEYVDTAMGYGVNLFGHNPEFVTKAIAEQLQKGMELGPQSALAGEVAQLACELTGNERIAFANSGTEAVMVAIRLARAVTKRAKIVRFVTSFHGSFDGVLAEIGEHGSAPMTTGIVPSMVEDTIVLRYGSEDSLQKIAEQGHEIAAVLVEPVQSRNPGLQPKQYLQSLRQLTRDKGIALVFDEMVTGFRVGQKGSQADFGVTADLTTYGKILGGGLPIGAIAGSKLYMDAIDGGFWQFGDKSGPGAETTFFAGTFCKHPLTMAASKAVLLHLKAHGEQLQADITAKTEALAQRLNQFFEANHVPLNMITYASMYRFGSKAAQDMPRFTLMLNLFFKLMQTHGVFVWERRTCFFSTAHTQADADKIYHAVVEATRELRQGGFSFRTIGAPEPDGGNSINTSDSKQSTSATNQAAQTPAEAASASNDVSSEEGRMYVLSQMPGGEQAYRISGGLSLTGKFDAQRFTNALEQVIAAQASLRTQYQIIDGKIQRHIVAPSDFALPLTFSESMQSFNQQQPLTQHNNVYTLDNAPLWQINVTRESDQHHVLNIDMHHLIADGSSVSILLNQLLKAYQERPLDNSTDYQHFVAWENQFLASDNYKKSMDYWQQQLSPLPEALLLPYDNARPAHNDFAGSSLHKIIDKTQTQLMRSTAAKLKTTPFNLLLSSFQILLHKLTQQEVLCVGIPFDRRAVGGFDNTIGMFAQTLAIRSDITDSMLISQLVSENSQRCAQAFTHSNVPLEHIVESLNVPRDMSRNPLFDSMFIYETGDARLQSDDFDITPVPMELTGASFDLTFEITEQQGELHCNFIYATRLFRAETIARWAGLFEQLLAQICEFCAQSDLAIIGDLGSVTDAEKQQIQQFGQGEINHTRLHRSVLANIDDYAQKYPDQPAISAASLTNPDEIVTLSYQQLWTQVEYVAVGLLEAGMESGQQIAVLLPRNQSLLVSLLAVWRIGCSYIPLDPEYPDSRIEYMLQHANVQCVLSLPESIQGRRLSCRVIDVTPLVQRARKLGKNQQSSIRNVAYDMPNIQAYTIYTSGSTGNPKGVVVNHSALNNFISSISERINFKAHSVTLGLTTISFDIFALEAFVTLTQGSCLVLANEQQQQNPQACIELIQSTGVTCVQITPSRLQLLLQAQSADQALAGVDTLLIGGEAFPSEYLPALQLVDNLNIFNVYGPTEATVWACVKDLTHAEQVTLGKPLHNTRAYVLGKQKQLLPLGCQGELFLAGDCLAEGYLHDEARTNAVFIDDPFYPGERMYATGDMAAWTTDGELRYHGRRDNQVKYRGYRIELGDIESALHRIDGIDQAVVLIREASAGNPLLVAFCLTQANATDFEQQVRQQLQQQLPDYMVPSLIAAMPSLPLTPNGKIDRNQLPTNISELFVANVEDDLIDTSNDDEITQGLRQIWRGLLGDKPISATRSFFDVGGNSFSLMLMHKSIDQQWPNSMQITDIFANPTINALHDLILAHAAVLDDVTYTGFPLDQSLLSEQPATTGENFKITLPDTLQKGFKAMQRATESSTVDLLMTLFSVYINKRFNNNQITLYWQRPEKGFVAINADFDAVSELNDLLDSVKNQRENNGHFPTPPELLAADGISTAPLLVLFQPESSQQSSLARRFGITINPANNLQQLDISFAAYLSQSSIHRLATDFVRLVTAIVGTQHATN